MVRIALVFLCFAPFIFGYNVSICAIFQNEAPYIKEWIEFHKIQGVEHFYLYNHHSTDEYLEVLNPYIESNEVTLTEWDYSYSPGDTRAWLAIQRGAYMDCVNLCKDRTNWLAVIDIDEFLFCPTGVKLDEFLQPYSKYGALCVNWLNFGTSNIEEIPVGQTLIECLTGCAHPLNPYNYQGKSIIQPKYVVSCKNVHTFFFSDGLITVDVAGTPIKDGRFLPAVSHDQIRINHYWTRTEGFFRMRKVQSRNERRSNETIEKLYSRANQYNEAIDTSILQFVPLLKSRK